MSFMFGATTGFNGDIGFWGVSSVTNMVVMFSNAGLSSTNYDALLNSWPSLPLQSNVNFNAGDSQGEAKATTVCSGFKPGTFL